MKQKHYTITLDRLDYDILKNNSMIMTCWGTLLKKVKMKDHEVELSLTEYELKELTGFVAAEANHATSKRKEQALGEIFEHLEAELYSLN